ncbi:PhzF family phenazine biosynthesis protein [Burkholderia multivorans]|uniref:PhzF family phenazine biosynthesis protein n=1 Tax=Burkholderia multivorans TaxID=87883 RepID=UPI001C21222F|nr:PhzF family phenazine biosynthesis protein [Burkholderia multivorans]MBU9480908.1 PhzF family phenazine biosynthesis protein [Burkholderia multivorans]
MSAIPFKQVDVFTSERFKGNPVAVVLRADDLTTEQMQQIASWTNLSETTFVVPKTSAEADYRVRIFTPGSELPFAGHPTIGTAYALLEAGFVKENDGTLIQECGAGLVRLEVVRESAGVESISFDLPEPTIAPLDEGQVNELESILGTQVSRQHSPALVDVGARWIIAQLPSAAAVLAVRPDFPRMREQDLKAKATGVVVFGEYDSGDPARIEVRAFAPACGVSEDPVCGSGNGAVAAFIRHSGQTDYFGASYTAAQGSIVGRAGMIRLVLSDDRIQVGGAAVTCIDGLVSV